MKKLFYGIALVVGAVVFIIAVIAFISADPFYLRATSDSELTMALQMHMQTFEQLRRMAADDRKRAYLISKAYVTGSLEPARWQMYKDLLAQTGGAKALAIDRSSVRFIFAEGGLSAISGGWLKGLQYCPTQCQGEYMLKKDLNNVRKLPPGDYLRPLAGDWFILYQRTSD